MPHPGHAADVVRDVLLEVARRRGTIRYDDLLAAVPEDLRDPLSSGGLAAVLRAVSIASDDAGKGLLTAVVVGGNGLPGGGWFRLAEERGRDVHDRDLAWRSELELVWEHV